VSENNKPASFSLPIHRALLRGWLTVRPNKTRNVDIIITDRIVTNMHTCVS